MYEHQVSDPPKCLTDGGFEFGVAGFPKAPEPS